MKSVKSIRDLYNEEEKIIASFEAKYRLNRVAGGINSEEDEKYRNLRLIASREERNFD